MRNIDKIKGSKLLTKTAGMLLLSTIAYATAAVVIIKQFPVDPLLTTMVTAVTLYWFNRDEEKEKKDDPLDQFRD